MLTPLDEDVARADARGENRTVNAGDARASEGRNQVFVSGGSGRPNGFIVVAPAPREYRHIEFDEPINYDVGIGALRGAGQVDDDVDVAYVDPFRG